MTTFGPFKLLHQLAEGGMAITWLARTIGAPRGHEFVLKRLHPRLVDSPSARAAFLEESEIMAALDHPNLACSLPGGEGSGEAWFPMDFIWGCDLRTMARAAQRERRRIPVAVLARIAAQAARGLAHAHAAKDSDGNAFGLVHRDISPPNIMVGFDGGTRVIDFGIARLNAGQTSQRVGQLKGRFAYMSPEQITGRDVDGRSDVFSLATVLWELCAVRRLFRSDSDLATAQRVLNGPIDALHTLRTDVDEPLSDIVNAGLARDPRQRPDALAFAEALEDWIKQQPGPPLQDNDTAALLDEICAPEKRATLDILGDNYPGPRPVRTLQLPDNETVSILLEDKHAFSPPRPVITRTLRYSVGVSLLIGGAVALLVWLFLN